MFDIFKGYQIILVTGPQRSGTTICARMIEHDLGYTYLDEHRWRVWDGQEARRLAEETWPCVLQGPGILKDVALFNQPKCAVILMNRDLDEIRQSQERIGWNIWAEKELSHYTEDKKWYDGVTTGESPADEVAWIKYMFWHYKGRESLTYKNWYIVEYELLKEHPLWVSKEQRQNFSTRQWKV